MRSTHRRGTMMIVAIVLLGLIGVALAGLTRQFASDFHRLQWQSQAAQSRQILIAATRSLLINPDKTLSLPATLRDAGAEVKISALARGANRAAFHIDVIAGTFHASEILTLNHAANNWAIADVQLQ